LIWRARVPITTGSCGRWKRDCWATFGPGSRITRRVHADLANVWGSWTDGGEGWREVEGSGFPTGFCADGALRSSHAVSEGLGNVWAMPAAAVHCARDSRRRPRSRRSARSAEPYGLAGVEADTDCGSRCTADGRALILRTRRLYRGRVDVSPGVSGRSSRIPSGTPRAQSPGSRQAAAPRR